MLMLGEYKLSVITLVCDHSMLVAAISNPPTIFPKRTIAHSP
jgi:hypothetical protein